MIIYVCIYIYMYNVYIHYIYMYIYTHIHIYIYTHPSIPSDSSVGHPRSDLPGGSLQKYRMGPHLLHLSTRCSRPPGFAWQILVVQVWRDFQRFVWKWGVAQLLAFSTEHHHPWRIHGAAIYGNMDPINIPQMLAYIPYMDFMGHNLLNLGYPIFQTIPNNVSVMRKLAHKRVFWVLRWDTVDEQISGLRKPHVRWRCWTLVFYPLVNIQKTMENHHAINR